MLANFGVTELAVILLIVIVLFGAKRIPEMGSSIGKGIREFKRGISDKNDPTVEHVATREHAAEPTRLQ